MSVCARVSLLALSLLEIFAWHREALIGERSSFLSKLAAAHVIVVIVVGGDVVVVTASLAPATALFVLERRLLVLLLSRELSHVGHIEPSTWERERVEVSSHPTGLALVEL